MKKILLILLTVSGLSAKSQLTITDSLTTTQIETLLTGIGVSISGLTINCHPAAIGHFSGISEVPITNGIALSTGYVDHIADTASAFAMTDLMMPGDSTIWNYVWATTGSPYNTYDGCAIEFDCIPLGDTLMFNFAFGSEEYPEYVGSGFNDAFGIFLTGPGISGPGPGGELNVAALPSGDMVSINNVNHLVNSTYYIDNSAGVNLVFDGVTSNLQVFAVVSPGSTYHFNVAISDVMDGIFDSGVMLEAFSFKSPFTTKIDQLTSTGLIQLFPNPANELLTVRSEETIQSISVTDLSGKLVLSQPTINANRFSLDVSTFTQGLYLMKIESESGISIEKFSKF